MDNSFPNNPQNPQGPQQPQYPPTPQFQGPTPGYGGQPPTPPNGRRLPQLKTWQWIAAGVGALVIVCCLCGGLVSAMNGANSANNANITGASNTNPTATHSGPTATPKPTATRKPAPKWTTVRTFTGNGIKKTPTFTAPDDWRIVWSCTPSSFSGYSYNVIVTVYNSDGSISDIAVNTICKSGNTSDYTEEHSGGPVYLDINSEGAWKIQVEELK